MHDKLEAVVLPVLVPVPLSEVEALPLKLSGVADGSVLVLVLVPVSIVLGIIIDGLGV